MMVEKFHFLEEPTRGAVVHNKDMRKILVLRALAVEHWGECWKVGLRDNIKRFNPTTYIDQLVYGATQVRRRYF
jgi:tRNA isopentenyl-2-thiomethyl-A-37 hydroxylase MiaE